MPDQPQPGHQRCLRALGLRMRELAEDMGCDMSKFAIEPDLDGDADIVQVIFILPDIVPDESTFDEQAAALLEAIEAHEAREAQKERHNPTR